MPIDNGKSVQDGKSFQYGTWKFPLQSFPFVSQEKFQPIWNFKCVFPFSLQSDTTHDIPLIKERKIPTLRDNYNKNFNVTGELFDGGVEDLNKLLKDTPMKGQGQAFLDAQEKYGINALFLMSITKVESGYGKNPARGTKYNVAGLKTRSGKYQQHKNYAASVDSLASSLKRLYINSSKKLVTVEKIKTQYCPGNKTWSKEICNEMNVLSRKIMEIYE